MNRVIEKELKSLGIDQGFRGNSSGGGSQ